MRARKRFGITMFVMASAFAVLACTCSALGGEEEATGLPELPTEQPTTAPEPTTPPEPTDAPEPTTPPEPTEAPVTTGTGLEMVQVNGYLDNYDILQIVGIIGNNTDRAVNDIDVEVEIFDANNNVIYSELTFTDLYNLAPGDATTFSLAIFEDLPAADRFEATIVGSGATTLNRAPIDIESVEVTIDDFGDAHITGLMVNNNDVPMDIHGVSGALFDTDENLITADTSSVSISYLFPGEEGPFRISINGPASGFENLNTWTVYVDAEQADAAPVLSLDLSDHHVYRDTFDGAHLVGEITNSGGSAVTVRLVAGLFDADGNVVDAAFTDTPFFTISAGETIPYDLTNWEAVLNTETLGDEVDRYVVMIDPGWTWERDDDTVVISTSGDQNTFDENEGVFSGQIVNDSGGPVDGATIVVYFRDNQTGQVIGTSYDWVFDEIPAGGSAPYEVYIPIAPGFDINTASYDIIVKGDLP